VVWSYIRKDTWQRESSSAENMGTWDNDELSFAEISEIRGDGDYSAVLKMEMFEALTALICCSTVTKQGLRSHCLSCF